MADPCGESAAAAAIMAALSVDKPGVGNSTGHGKRAPAAALRNPWLQATPPETITVDAPISSAERIMRNYERSFGVHAEPRFNEVVREGTTTIVREVAALQRSNRQLRVMNIIFD